MMPVDFTNWDLLKPGAISEAIDEALGLRLTMRTLTCDSCGSNLQDKPWHLGLDSRRMPVTSSDKSPLDREYHFCELSCLAEWVLKNTEKALDKILQQSGESRTA